MCSFRCCCSVWLQLSRASQLYVMKNCWKGPDAIFGLTRNTKETVSCRNHDALDEQGERKPAWTTSATCSHINQTTINRLAVASIRETVFGPLWVPVQTAQLCWCLPSRSEREELEWFKRSQGVLSESKAKLQHLKRSLGRKWNRLTVFLFFFHGSCGEDVCGVIGSLIKL